MNKFLIFVFGIIFPELIFKIKTDKKVVYLTFDDGPTPEVTPQVLSILKQYNAKATFFCLGKNVESNKDLYNQIIEEGHSVGNHSNNHLKGLKTPNEEYFNNIDFAKTKIESDLFRPPYGSIGFRQMNNISKDFKIIIWNVLSKDYDKRISPLKCLNRVLKNISKGSIIVFHDSIKAKHNVLNVLPKLLENLKTNNYNCDRISL